MRILLANTFHYYRGGASVYVLKLAELLESHGHEVFHFAMQHPQSLPCPKTEDYWPPNIEYPELLKKKTPANVKRVLSTAIHNKAAEEGIRRLITEKGHFDIAHLNNIMHHLTPSILYPLKEAGIPVVWTLHDYSLICPNTNFINNRTGKLCSKCISGGLSFLNAPLSRCKKDSIAASSMAIIEAWALRRKRITQMVDAFISPSSFLIDRFAEASFDRSRFFPLRYFVESSREKPPDERSDALYAGRLSTEKGVQTLIDAWQEMGNDKMLKIAGSGPAEEALRRSAEGMSNIEFLGFVNPEELGEIRRNSAFTIAPSICWDNFPISVMESLADGIPVLGSRIGGIPEMINDRVNGLLFEPGNPADLRNKA
ncbi:MAG TPA: glycosyltransferase, partial [candidate division Zixibacteria bacterium]|nr:glycosyltransferase [candidate division Zixibacteria bacterium]